MRRRLIGVCAVPQELLSRRAINAGNVLSIFGFAR